MVNPTKTLFLQHTKVPSLTATLATTPINPTFNGHEPHMRSAAASYSPSSTDGDLSSNRSVLRILSPLISAFSFSLFSSLLIMSKTNASGTPSAGPAELPWISIIPSPHGRKMFAYGKAGCIERTEKRYFAGRMERGSCNSFGLG